MSNDDDDLAYDGSNNPPKRNLTARERDILCRILTDVLHEYRKAAMIIINNPNISDFLVNPNIPDLNSVNIRIGEDDFFTRIHEIRDVIDPRN